MTSPTPRASPLQSYASRQAQTCVVRTAVRVVVSLGAMLAVVACSVGAKPQPATTATPDAQTTAPATSATPTTIPVTVAATLPTADLLKAIDDYLATGQPDGAIQLVDAATAIDVGFRKPRWTFRSPYKIERAVLTPRVSLIETTQDLPPEGQPDAAPWQQTHFQAVDSTTGKPVWERWFDLDFYSISVCADAQAFVVWKSEDGKTTWHFLAAKDGKTIESGVTDSPGQTSFTGLRIDGQAYPDEEENDDRAPLETTFYDLKTHESFAGIVKSGLFNADQSAYLVYTGGTTLALLRHGTKEAAPLWTFDQTDEYVRGRPIIIGDVVLAASSSRDQSGRVYGLDAKTGKQLWSQFVPRFYDAAEGRPPPQVGAAGPYGYLLEGKSGIAFFDPKTGRRIASLTDHEPIAPPKALLDSDQLLIASNKEVRSLRLTSTLNAGDPLRRSGLGARRLQARLAQGTEPPGLPEISSFRHTVGSSVEGWQTLAAAYRARGEWDYAREAMFVAANLRNLERDPIAYRELGLLRTIRFPAYVTPPPHINADSPQPVRRGGGSGGAASARRDEDWSHPLPPPLVLGKRALVVAPSEILDLDFSASDGTLLERLPQQVPFHQGELSIDGTDVVVAGPNLYERIVVKSLSRRPGADAMRQLDAVPPSRLDAQSLPDFWTRYNWPTGDGPQRVRGKWVIAANQSVLVAGENRTSREIKTRLLLSDWWHIVDSPRGLFGHGKFGVCKLDDAMNPKEIWIEPHKQAKAPSMDVRLLRVDDDFVALVAVSPATSPDEVAPAVLQIWSADGSKLVRQVQVNVGAFPYREQTRLQRVGDGYLFSGAELTWVPCDADRPTWRLAVGLEPHFVSRPGAAAREFRSRTPEFGPPRLVADKLLVPFRNGRLLVFDVNSITAAGR